MYNEELEAIAVSVKNLFLDPNNPRFFDEGKERRIAEEKITDETEQSNTQDHLIEKFGIEELFNSILRNGFLPLDRIVVRPIQGQPEMYVAVEGNRRLAALKLLHQRIEDNEISETNAPPEYLEKLKEKTNQIEVLLYKGSENDISWILQGIRHISGIKDWEPALRARLVAEQIDEAGLNFTEAAQKFGLTAVNVGRLYRAFKALQQMKGDTEYGPKYRNEYYSLFEEAYKNTKVRQWLGWDEERKIFTNEDKLKQFYSWIVPDEEHEDKKRRIHDPKHLRFLAEFLEKKREDLIGQIDRHEISVEVAYGQAIQTQTVYNWEAEIKKAKNIIDSIPSGVMQDFHNELSEKLQELQSTISQQMKMLEALSNSSAD